MCQAPARAAQGWIYFSAGDNQYDHILLLIIKCIEDLPLIINPLGILTLRSWSKTKQSEEHREEDLLMISTESEEFEDAFFKAKTTSL